MRPIDADALLAELDNTRSPGAPYVDAGISIAIGKVCDAPTVEPERKTGRWIMTSNGISNGMLACSNCFEVPINRIIINGNLAYDMTPIRKKMRFCPNCGARMEDGE